MSRGVDMYPFLNGSNQKVNPIKERISTMSKNENVTPGYFGRGKRLFSTKEAAAYLGIKVQTLYNWRHNRKGPDYVLICGTLPRYEEAALDRFIDSNRVCLSA